MGNAKGYDSYTNPYSLICPWYDKKPMHDIFSMSNLSTTYEILGPGMILFKNYVSLKDQAEIVNICEKWGAGPGGGFYIPRCQNGEELRLQMMCFGRNWDPITRYEKRFRSDGSEPPAIPSKFISLVETAIQDAQSFLDGFPSMRPDVCVANFYSPVHGRLDIHQDRDESSDSLQKGLPVVSISIGDAAHFVYNHTRDENKLDRVFLESGDVLIFGGKSRLISHGLQQVFRGTAPRPLLLDTALMSGRLNLTLRQF
ncbi:hypothetical protein SSX86_013881 [Deinandra increscens subsp. villosa]|uniref:Alpha-ketoglutarate-dependent dioxygenase AlkB-like domain-containing protein n=1 Tax=Deinandra increscens subsp. villosa TaxID=3103831 RepID=A0AAP0D505_9ASTR